MGKGNLENNATYGSNTKNQALRNKLRDERLGPWKLQNIDELN